MLRSGEGGRMAEPRQRRRVRAPPDSPSTRIPRQQDAPGVRTSRNGVAMTRRSVLALSLVPVLFSAAALAVVGPRAAPARADGTTRQIPSSGTTAIRGGATGSGAIQSPEFTPAKHFKSDVTRNSAGAQAAAADRVAAAQAAVTDRSLSRSSGLRGRAAAKVAGARLASSPRLNRSFAGLNHRDQRTANGGNQFSLEPPDQGLCVGNGFVLETVNDVLRVFDKAGNPLTGVTDQNTFYGYPPAITRPAGPFGPFITDPSCLFDKVTRRWFHVALTLDVDPVSGDFLGTNHLDIAVSRTSDPRGQWAIYRLPVHDNGADGTPDHGCEGGFCLGDYPQIGADAFGFYITTNEYPFFANGFHAAQLYAFNKFALARNAANVNVTQFDTIGSVAGNPGFTLRPAVVPSFRYELAQGGTEYFLSSMAAEEANGSGTDNRIAIWSLTRTATLLTPNPAPVLRNSIINVGSYSLSPKADQKPGDFPLGQCINDTTLTYPTVGATDDGDAVISFTLVGADHYPSAAYAGLSAKSGAGAVKVAAEGLGVSDGFTSYKAFVGDPPRTRWGDYGATVADGNTIWIAAEYIGQTCTLAQWFAAPVGSCGGTRTALANWGTRISNVTP